MMHLPGQLQWDCKTIKSCHKRLHLLMSATSNHSITVVTHLLKSFKFLCLTSYVGFDKLWGTDVMKKIVYRHTRFVQEWVKKKSKTQLHPKNFITKITIQLQAKKKVENWYVWQWYFTYIYLMLKSIRTPGTIFSTMWKKNRVGRVISLKSTFHHLTDRLRSFLSYILYLYS